ncbi:MAG: hypothetical protein ACR2K5_15775 [Pseudolabrys sp.]
MACSKICLGLVAAALAALATLAAPSARAFTIENSATNRDGSAKYSDPDNKYGRQSSNKDGTTTFQFGGGTTMTVGPQRSFDNDFNSGKNRLLSPLDRDR